MLVRSADGDAEPTCTLYPWDRVGRTHCDHGISRWIVYDEAGDPIRANRRRNLVLTLRKGHLGEAALRAQHRAYRQAWHRGNLRIVEHYRFPLGLLFPILIGLAFAGLSIVLFAVALMACLRPHPLFQDQPVARVVVWILPALGGCLYGLLGYACGWVTLRVLLHSRIHTSRIDSEGIRVYRRDGTERYGAWIELREIRWPDGPLLHLLFEDGTEIWLAQPPQRTVAAIRAIEGILLPGNQRKTEKHIRNSLIRCVVYWLLTALLAPILLYSIRPNPSVWLIGPVFALIPGLFYLHWRVNKFEKARLRRKQRRQRRQAQKAGTVL